VEDQQQDIIFLKSILTGRKEAKYTKVFPDHHNKEKKGKR